MQNQLAFSGERIDEKVYPQLLNHVGLIRGEYLLRELNQNILLPSCQQFVKDYLDGRQANQHGFDRRLVRAL